MVECLLCHREFTLITESHLKSWHGITTSQYTVRFPMVSMRDENFIKDPEARSKAISKTWWSKSQEERNKIRDTLSKAHLGKPLSEKHRENMIKGVKESHNTSEYLSRHSKIMSGVMREVWKRPGYRTKKAEEMRRRSLANWRSSEFRKKVMDSHHKSPSQDERIILIILDREFPGCWEFTGDKTFIGGGKKKPDYTHTLLKKVIEYEGSPFYMEFDIEGRNKHYRDLGYDCLTIFRTELWNAKTSELVAKIRDFMDRKW